MASRRLSVATRGATTAAAWPRLVLWAILAALPALLLMPLIAEAAPAAAEAKPPRRPTPAPGDLVDSTGVVSGSDFNDSLTSTADPSHSQFGHSGKHNCALGALICVHSDLKPFLITALWLLFLVVLLLVFERTEHQTHHQQLQHQQQLAASSSGSLDDGQNGKKKKSRMKRASELCDRLVHGIKEYLPTSCMQITLGLAFAGAFQVTGYAVPHLQSLEPGLFFHFLLPIIIINAGLGVEKRHFYFNLPAILAYAVVDHAH